MNEKYHLKQKEDKTEATKTRRNKRIQGTQNEGALSMKSTIGNDRRIGYQPPWRTRQTTTNRTKGIASKT